MSLLPLSPSAAPRSTRAADSDIVTPRSRSTERAARTERPDGADRSARTDRSEQADERAARDRAIRERVGTPPDFGSIMALIALAASREAQAARTAARGDTPAPDEATPVDEAVNESVSAEAQGTIDTTDDTSRRGLGSWSLEQLQTELQRRTDSVGTDPLASVRRVARTVLASASPAATAPSELDARTAALAPRGLSTDDRQLALAALAERAQGANVSELLARGDREAAGLRGRLDALLDAAGTARGRAIAESARPEFANAVARSAADVNAAVRDVDALAPEFKGRLDRVIDRMRDEFGHDVQVVETVRSPERQEHLHAQGRTRPGPVVTWTLDSAHLSGEAADVIVDGKWNNPQGYARLHAIAAEEGLHTLGMRDPGHLELRGSAGNGARTLSARATDDSAAAIGASGVGGAGMASVARVAQVAQVASVARVATVARPGATGLARAAERIGRDPGTPAPAATDGLPASASRAGMLASAGAASRPAGGDTSNESGQDAAGERDRRASRVSELNAASARATASMEGTSAIGSLSPSTARLVDQGIAAVEAPAESTAAARAESIAVLREDAPARPLTSLTMQLETPDGPEQVRVSLRGGVVGAQVNTSNAELADRLRLQTADLQDALGRHGLDTEPMRVQQTSRTQDADAARLAMADRGETLKAAGAAAGQQSGFEQGGRDRQPARPQQDRDARDAQQDPHQQRRRDDRQEQR